MAPGPAGLKPSGGHFIPGRKDLRALGYVAESDGLVTATQTASGLPATCRPRHTGRAAFLVVGACRHRPPKCCAPWPPRASSLWMHELATALGKKPTGGHWNSGIPVLRNMG